MKRLSLLFALVLVGACPRVGAVDEAEGSDASLFVVNQSIASGVGRAGVTEDGIGYALVAEFVPGTTRELRRVIRAMQERMPLTAFVLDLRSNRGGIDYEAMQMVDLFIDTPGLPIVLDQHIGDDHPTAERVTTRGDILGGKLLVVLANRHTASSSEVVVGALKDHHRTMVFGERTFGKGTAQRYVTSGGSRLPVTTLEFFRPSGEKVNGIGIPPDRLFRESESPLFSERALRGDKMYQAVLRFIRNTPQ